MRFLIATLLVATVLAGCTDNTVDDITSELPVITPTWLDRQTASHPAFGFPTISDYTGLDPAGYTHHFHPPEMVEIPEVITGLEVVGGTSDVTAAGIAVWGHYAIASGNGPASIVDIHDPANPVKVAEIDASTRDADIIIYPDGRVIAVLASNGPIHVVDVTNPTAPEYLTELSVSSHNAVVVPGTPIVYNAGSAGGGLTNPQGAYTGNGDGVTEIFDLTDPENPIQLDTFENGYGCHDITTFIDAANEKFRAYCAGIEMTQIWDITDPTAPEVIVNVPVHHGVAGTPSGSIFLTTFSHLAMTNHDGSILIVGDETGGGAVPPGCDANVAGQSGPLGNLWFYDISDETNPIYQGHYSPSAQALEGRPMATCTAHFGRLVEDRDVLAAAFYGAGVVLVDFSDPMSPTPVAQFKNDSDTWDAWYYRGHIVTGDLANGVQVLKIV